MPWASFLGASSEFDPDTVGDVNNALGDVTEEAAVGAQLLALRDDGGHSRFVLVPGHPEVGAGGSGYPGADEASSLSAEALEVRIVLRELLLLGSARHTDKSESVNSDVDMAPTPASSFAHRVAKVCYRKRPCGTDIP